MIPGRASREAGNFSNMSVNDDKKYQVKHKPLN
jgi:hypothetical protein